MQKYIGMDVHATTCSFGIINQRGKKIGQAVIETNGAALVQYLKTIAGPKNVCMEEGTQSAWLYEILSPHVNELVVTRVAEKSLGRKDDISDAFKLGERLRMGDVLPVYKEKGQFSKLRAQSDVYSKVNSDSVRVQCRLKALFRSRGVSTPSVELFKPEQREQWVKKLPWAYQRAAQLLYQQYDAVQETKQQAQELLKKESHNHPISYILQTAPGMGPIRVAQLMSIVVTPYRFRTSRQLWAYSGLAIVMRSSSDWTRTANGWQRVNLDKTRGLNRDYNRTLKCIFKGAATTVIQQRMQPLYDDYLKQLQQGTKPPLAKLTLARRIAAMVLAMWKSKEEYDTKKYRTKK
jgi:transposase